MLFPQLQTAPAIAINYKSLAGLVLQMGIRTLRIQGLGVGMRMTTVERRRRMWTRINIPNMTMTLSECFKLKRNLPFTAAETWIKGSPATAPHATWRIRNVSKVERVC